MAPAKAGRMIGHGTEDFGRNLLVFGILATAAFAGVAYFFSVAPQPKGQECDDVSLAFVIRGVLPKFIGGRDDRMGTVKSLWTCATAYQKDNSTAALIAYCLVYITLQTFAIPGPIVLSILSGALYPFVGANLLVSFCATTGASLCFGLSYLLGRGILYKLMPAQIEKFRTNLGFCFHILSSSWGSLLLLISPLPQIQSNRSNLFYYILFLRITPLLPNWFVNIASPVVGVPFHLFFFGTLLGLMPANFLHISTGATLHSATETSGTSNAINFAILFALQFVALLPTLFKKRLAQLEEQKFAAKSKKE